ncbi:hypothetical protein RUM44_008759 [Polyplax serrata]|uniref:Uncharacterized protein n=1 Tax=Polyplax serrata TaxID=468196 RepID=A0ABR1B966_POLSC
MTNLRPSNKCLFCSALNSVTSNMKNSNKKCRKLAGWAQKGIGTKKNEKQNTDDKNLLHGYFFPDTWDDKSTHFQFYRSGNSLQMSFIHSVRRTRRYPGGGMLKIRVGVVVAVAGVDVGVVLSFPHLVSTSNNGLDTVLLAQIDEIDVGKWPSATGSNELGEFFNSTIIRLTRT